MDSTAVQRNAFLTCCDSGGGGAKPRYLLEVLTASGGVLLIVVFARCGVARVPKSNRRRGFALVPLRFFAWLGRWLRRGQRSDRDTRVVHRLPPARVLLVGNRERCLVQAPICARICWSGRGQAVV